MSFAIQDHFADPILDDMLSREVIVDNRSNSNELEDYQVSLEIDEKQLFFEVQDGLRFVDENLQIIDHWNESFPDKEWIEVPKIPSSAICALRMLDGDASSASNGTNTFLFFDDFPGSSIDTSKWSVTGNGISVSGSIVTLTTSSTNTQNRLTSLTDWSKNNSSSLRARLKTQYSGATNRGEQTFGASDNTYYITAEYNHRHSQYSGKYYSNYNGDGFSNIVGWAADTWKIQELKRPGLARWTVNDANQVNHSSYYPTNDYPIWIRADYNTNPATMWVDWILIRKYASTEPLTYIGM